MAAPILPVCGCPITKTLTVNFTGSDPAPAGGYIVKWAAGNGSWNYVTPNPTSSPISIPNVPVCEDITVVMQSQCDNSQVSAEQTTVVPAYSSNVCSDVISGTHTHNGYYAYPSYLLDTRAATSTVTLTYDVIDVPNRFTIYDSNGNLIVTSGWRGVAAYPGPWGGSLNTTTTGSISFTATDCFYRLLVESNTNTSYADAFSVSIACPTEGDPVIPTITYISCSNGYGSYRINAPSGTNLKVSLTASGNLINSGFNGNCAQLQGLISSSTGPSDNENSNVISSSGAVSIGTGNSLFVDVTVPGTGYLVINTVLMAINSTASMISATLKVFEINGSTPNPDTITQSVCAYNSTGTVSCGAATYMNYFADVYQCGNCGIGPVQTDVLVAFPTGVSVVQGKFYLPDPGSGYLGTYVYLVGASTNAGPGLIMQDVSATTCVQACTLSIE